MDVDEAFLEGFSGTFSSPHTFCPSPPISLPKQLHCMQESGGKSSLRAVFRAELKGTDLKGRTPNLLSSAKFAVLLV